MSPLQEAALKRFAEQGFSGTSLAQIAADTGIKPPSIYAHCRSKEELFLSLVEPAIEAEMDYIGNAWPQADQETLYRFLGDTEKRFNTAPVFRFLLHSLYLRPKPLTEKVDTIIVAYMKELERMLTALFQNTSSRLDAETLANAYAGIMDSLQAEILYGGAQSFQKRLDALWKLFLLAL